jgi:hypothetical protein
MQFLLKKKNKERKGPLCSFWYQRPTSGNKKATELELGEGKLKCHKLPTMYTLPFA